MPMTPNTPSPTPWITLEDAGALCVHVSGSGPVLFALFDTGTRRHEAAERLDAAFSEGMIRVLECEER